MDKLLNKKGTDGSSMQQNSMYTLVQTMKGQTTSETTVTVESSNPNAQQNVAQQSNSNIKLFRSNEKLVGKLLSNLGKLQDMSSVIQNRMQNHDDEIQQKQKKEQLLKQEQSKALEMKLNRIKGVVDNRQSNLKEKEDNHEKTKADLDNLVLEKSGAIKQINESSQLTLKEKDLVLKKLQEEIAKLKEEIKEIRSKRKSLDDLLFNLQEMILKKKILLKEISSNAADKDKIKADKQAQVAELKAEIDNLQKLLSDLKDQIKKQQDLNDQLKKKLEELLAIKDKLKEQAYLLPQDLQQTQDKLETLKREIQKLKDDLIDLNKTLDQKKALLENEIKKQQELLNTKQHIQLTHQIQKEGRQHLKNLQDLDQRLRQLQINSIQSQKVIAQLVQEGGMKNEDLEQQYVQIISDIQKALGKRSEIKNEINIIEEKLLQNSDLPIDILKAYTDKLKAIENKVTNLTKDTVGLEQLYAKKEQEYQQFVKKIQDTYLQKINSQSAENKELIVKILTLQKDLGNQVGVCDKKLETIELLDENQVDPMVNIKVKISQFLAQSKQVSNTVGLEQFKLDKNNVHSTKLSQDYILNYVHLNIELEKQRDRLKQILDHDLSELMKKLLNEIEQALKDLEKLVEDNKKNSKRENLKGLENLGGKIDEIIDSIEKRMDELQDEINKLDLQEYGSLKDHIQKELDQLQKELNDCKDKNKKLKDEVERLGKLSDEELAKIDTLDDLKDQFNSIEFHELPPIDKALDDLEKKLRNAINRKKNDVKQDCLDTIDNDKIKMKQLSDILDKLEKEIARVEHEGENLERAYRYKDLERDHDMENKINNKLKDHKEVLKVLKGSKDQLQAQITALEDRIYADTNSSIPQEEQLKNWGKHLEEALAIGEDIDYELSKAKDQQTKLNGTAQDLTELTDKYNLKDKIYRKCLESQKQKQNKLDNIKRNAQALEKKFNNVDETLNNIQAPNDGGELVELLSDKKLKLNAIKNKMKNILDRAAGIQNKIDTICAPLKHMNEMEVMSPDLQKIIEELNKLDVLIQELSDDLKDLQSELDQLLDEINKFLDKSKNLKLEEVEKAWQLLQAKLKDTDKKFVEVDGKLSKYVQKIKECTRTFSDDEEILDELKRLKGESDGIDKHLRKTDGQRTILSGKDRQAKDLLNKYKANKTPPTNEDIQSLVDKFRQLAKESVNIHDDLQQMSDDLDKRIEYLDAFLKRGNELQDLFKQYQKLASDLNKGFRNFSKNLDDANDMSGLLNEVLYEMEQGLERDYVNKGEFISQKQGELGEQEDLLKQLGSNRELLGDALENLQVQKIMNIVQCDLSDLNEQIPRYEELLNNLKTYDQDLQEVVKAFTQIKTDIGTADVPKNIKAREQELNQFSILLKQYEQDLADIRKLSIYNPIFNIAQDVKIIEKAIKDFTEDKVKFSRILKQELLMYEQQPSKLEPLTILKDIIEKVRDLGDKLQKALELLNQGVIDANKLKKQIGGQDSLNKWKGLEMKEDDLRQRLNDIKKRFKVIYKGGEDCDGYTSNPEEDTFIDSLLEKRPEVTDKQLQILELVDEIQGKIFDVKSELDELENQDFMKQSKELGAKLNDIEDKILSAEQDVVFLEKLSDSLEEKFMAMQAQSKLDKRQTEISEVAQVAIHFQERVKATQDSVNQDLQTIQNQTKYLEKMGVNPAEDKNKEDLLEIKEELKQYSKTIMEIFEDIATLESKRQGAQNFFDEKIVKESPYKKTKSPKKDEHFLLLDLNSQIKKKILDLIKLLKLIQNNIRDIKRKYQQLRSNYASLLSRKMYSSLKGDLVDEQVGEYINKLQFDIPIKKTGNNCYTIGSKRVIAQLINEKLMVRVGGGYVGMDEFMMVYGSAELIRIQREEMTKFTQDFDFIKTELLAQYFVGDNLGEDTLDVDPSKVELLQLKSKIKADYNSRKGRLYRTHEIGERPSSEGRKPVVGILDARNALKKNIQSIVTSETVSVKGNKTTTANVQNNQSQNKPQGKFIDRALQNQKNYGSNNSLSFSGALPSTQKRMSMNVKSKPLANTQLSKPPTSSTATVNSIAAGKKAL